MMHDNIDATVPAKTAMATAQVGGSRFALGDIGNIGAKVSSLTLDPNKKTGAIKKEILGQQPTITRQKTIRRAVAAVAAMAPATTTVSSTATNLNSVTTSIKASALKTEIYNDFRVRVSDLHSTYSTWKHVMGGTFQATARFQNSNSFRKQKKGGGDAF